MGKVQNEQCLYFIFKLPVKVFQNVSVVLIGKYRMPLVVKTLSFNSLVWYPKAAHLSSNITYPLYTSVAQHY